ncbi:MAG: hypothetical protein GY861_18690 [bacterium]|nr:hypothetical protein [bacterium]
MEVDTAMTIKEEVPTVVSKIKSAGMVEDQYPGYYSKEANIVLKDE